jgi:hypothetical protein
MRGIALAVALVAATPALAAAQLEALLNPKLGELAARSDYRLTFYPEQRVAGQPTTLELLEHRVSFFVPVVQTSRDELALSASARLEDYDTRAVLPRTGERWPTELWDVKAGPAYRHAFDNGWIGGAVLSIGSASDKPFASGDELIVQGSAFLRVPRGERDAWLFMLNYSNVSEFGGIPLPGLAYIYSPSEEFTAIIGLPFASVEYKPVDKLTLQATYQALRKVRLRATYEVFRPLRVWVGFDWDHDMYLRADRRDTDDRLFYYEKRWSGGARFDLRHVGFELSGGYAFDRFFFEGDGYSDRHRNRFDVHAGPFVVGRISVRF